MAKIEKFNSINSIMEEGEITSIPRTYLGYSSLGSSCMRKLWYGFRWVAPDSASRRMNRIWDRGHIEEDRIFDDLRRVGVEITGVEQEVVGVTGHLKGHCDGILFNVPTAEKTPHLFEAKTMKHSSFVSYLKKGLRMYSPAYWQQIHSYMGHLNLTRCLYVVVDKDTETRDYQRIKYDKDQFDEGERIGFNIIAAGEAPPRMANASSTFFECKWCCFKEVCHKGAQVAKNCRTCVYWDIEEEGRFSCSKWKHDLEKEMQLLGCKDYEKDTIYDL